MSDALELVSYATLAEQVASRSSQEDSASSVVTTSSLGRSLRAALVN